MRGSKTSLELDFHTDNAFVRMLPDYVGLVRRRSAKRGAVHHLHLENTRTRYSRSGASTNELDGSHITPVLGKVADLRTEHKLFKLTKGVPDDIVRG
jgi:hypothetical protein